MKSEILLFPPVKRYLKKIKDKHLRKKFDEVFEKILDDPTIGQTKTGDLNGVYVYGFFYNKTEYRVAYQVKVNEDGSITIIIMVGVHENFYDDLKNYMKQFS